MIGIYIDIISQYTIAINSFILIYTYVQTQHIKKKHDRIIKNNYFSSICCFLHILCSDKSSIGFLSFYIISPY